ncbi:MAG: secretin N-terminal domain-containing protein, partial [Acidobacteriota bacterium]
MINPNGRFASWWHGERRRKSVALVAALWLLPTVATAQQQERLPAGELPTQAAVLLDETQNGVPIDIDFVDTDIRDVVRFFSQLTNLNIVVDPQVSGPVTVTLFDVPWDIALISILQTHDLGYSIDRNVVRITTTEKLATEAENRAKLVEQERNAAPLVTEKLTLSYARAGDLQALAESQLTERGEAIIDERTNSLILKDTPTGVETVRDLIGSLDVASPQVNITARIVETTRDFSRALGIQWGFQGVADAAHGNTTGLVFPNSLQVQGHNVPSTGATATGIGGTPFAVNLPAADAISGVSLTLGSVLDSFRLDL